jgi:WD40 repeat protein
VQDVDFSPDGRLLASASLNGTVTVWDVARKKDVWTLGTPQATLDLAVRFSPDGKLVAVGDSSGTVVLWSVQTGRPVGQPLQGHNGDVRSLDFDPSGRRLVTSSDDGRLRLWDVETQKLIGAPLPGSTTGGSAEFFPDGKHVLGVFESGTGVVWNVDPVAWKGYACRIANRNLTRAEWNDVLPGHPYRRVCST